MKILLGLFTLFLGTFWAEAAPISFGINDRVPKLPSTSVNQFNVAAKEMGSNIPLTEADPGQYIEVKATLFGKKNQFYRPEDLTVLSMTGATLEPGANVYYYVLPNGSQGVDPINSIPHSYQRSALVNTITDINSPAFILKIRVGGLDSKGRGVPIRIKARFQGYYQKLVNGEYTGRFPVDVIQEFTLPVSDAPALEVTPSFTSVHQGELRPDGTATIKYRVTAAGSSMKNISLRATAPKGTDFTGVFTPNDGTQAGNQIAWLAPGPLAAFEATAQIRVKARPGVKTAVAKYSAAAEVVDTFLKKKSGTLKMPIKSFLRGTIDYAAPAGLNGPVEVGGTYVFYCQEWDKEGGDIFVSLDDAGVTSVSYAPIATGTFDVPPFHERDLTHILSAYQKAKPSDTEVTGDPLAQLELLLGVVKITDGTTIFRRLRKGDPIAVGEAPESPDITAGSNRFGLLQIDGPTGAALVRFGGNNRLLYGRNGNVAMYGSIAVKSLRLLSGRSAMVGSFRPTGLDLTAYDPAGNPGLTTISSAQTTSTAESPLDISGNTRAGTLSHSGPVKFNGGLLYVQGNLTILGDIDGVGAIVCTGNFTHKGKLKLTTSNELVLGVVGSFTTAE